MTIKTVDQFNKTLTTFTKQQRNSQKNVWECAKFALLHFEKCGDLGPLQRIYDAMSKGYANRNGLVRWAMSFAPIQFEQSKFSKDKSADALDFALKEAFKQPFWESFPIAEKTVFFSTEDVQKALDNIVKKFERDNHRTTDKNAVKAIKTLKAIQL
jgi:hypothetical protein